MNVIPNLKITLALAMLGAAAIFTNSPDRTAEYLESLVHRRLAELHAAEVEMLKVDWSGPQVFCTQFSPSYDKQTHECRKTISTNRKKAQ